MKIANMSVELVDYMGSDLSVVNAARVSFAKESDWNADSLINGDKLVLEERDEKLINYLAKHNHWTPFAHAFASFRIKAPIFVARQLVKHQVGLAWNEVSRRYVDDEPEYYLPSSWRSRPASNIKQGSGGVFDTKFMVEGNKEVMDVHASNLCYAVDQLYKQAIHNGMAPEQARMILPQNTMTEWIWSGSLAAFCRVCKLRLDPHAQLETQELVGYIKAHLEPLFPISFKALTENE